jgi:hypothetical protein
MNYDELNEIAKSRIGLNLDDYAEKNNTQITFLQVDLQNKTVQLNNGCDKDKKNFEDYFETSRSFENKTTVAGYINKKRGLPNSVLSSDIVFINKKLLEKDFEYIELIIIHELCHLIEQNNLIK